MKVKSSVAFPRACEERTECNKIKLLDSADSCCLPVYYVPRPEHPTLSNLQITNSLSVRSEITASHKHFLF